MAPGEKYKAPATIRPYSDSAEPSDGDVLIWSASENDWVPGEIEIPEVPDSDFELIERQVITGADQAAVTFAAIPQTYESLRLIAGPVRGDKAAAALDSILINFNNDTAGNYSNQAVIDTNTSVSAQVDLGQTSLWCGRMPAASATAGYSGHLQVDIPGYARTVFHKTARVDNFYASSAAAAAHFHALISGRWADTAAITEIDLTCGSKFLIGSVFTLYGIRGA